MKNPLVVGYKGEIGSFILGGLLRVMPKALNIWCVDVNETVAEVSSRIEISDVIFLCLPMHKTIEWLEKYERILCGKIIVEQASSKEWIYKHPISQRLSIESMHILFRPSQTPNIEDRRVALFKLQHIRLMAEDIAAITQSKIVWFNGAEEHDREMALQQALLHRTILVLGKLFDECKGQTYVSKKILELRDRIQKGNLELYSDIQKNPHLQEQLIRFDKSMAEFNITQYWK